MSSCLDKSMNILRNEKGIALITALIMGLVGMLMLASILLLVQSGTWITGSKKRYLTALDAAHGGMNFYAREVVQRGLAGTTLTTMGNDNYSGQLALTRGPLISDANLTTKLTTTGAYPPANASDVDATLTYTMPSGGNILVDSSIRRTSLGNSGTSSTLLEGGGVVDTSGGKITPQHIPYLYQIETRARSTANETAGLSAIYAY